ncbi:MAG: MBL fold metallo-hydrolase [Phycisphaerales bacterium]
MFMRMVYDENLAQAAYIIGCQRAGEAIVFDPERDVDRYIDIAKSQGLKLVAAAETHIHADFLSGSRELAERVGAKVYLSDEGDADWKYQWLDKKSGGGSYDHVLLKDGNTFTLGAIEFKAIHTPGHTPEHLCYLVTDRGSGADEPIGLVSGDFLFVGDLGRPDLLETAAGHAGAMEPSAKRLYQSLQVLNDLPDFVQVWPGHGAGSACGKSLGAIPTSTIGYERRFNPALRAATGEQAFVDFILSGQPEPPMYFARMKRDNKMGPKVLGALPTPSRIKHTQLAELNTRRAAVIDTRPWPAFRAGHVPGSLSLPLGKPFPTDAGSLIGEDEPITLIVEASRLDEAVRQLVRIGLDDIRGWMEPRDLDAFAGAGHALATIEDVTTDQAAAMLTDGKARVLDVRRASEYAQGHLPGAVNIAHTRLPGRLDEAPKEQTLIVHCQGGWRSARAASYLKRHGYHVVNLPGGYAEWAAAGRPVGA